MISSVIQIKQQLLSPSLPSVRLAEAKQESGVRTNEAVKMGRY